SARIPADADPTYIAPELMNGPRSDPTADIYSLSALLFHLLSGNPPMPPANAPAAERLREWKPPDFSLLPDGITELARSILGTALSRMPNGRFLTFYGMMTACEKAVQHLSDGALQSIRLLRKPMTKPAQALLR